MVQAIVAIEDRRFWEHQGVDARGIARALWADVRHQRVVEGGSTITQQYVKNMYVTNARTIARKVREAALAWQLERSPDWPKQRILAEYLNTIYFGNGAYGIQQAARIYFDKSAADLNLAESALLAGIPADPTGYDPVTHPGAARARRAQVLDAMLQVGYLTPREHANALRAPLPDPENVRFPGTEITWRAPYFTNYVKAQLIERRGARDVYGGGLRVTTTIDLDMQEMARKAIVKWLPDAAGPDAALVAMNRADGRRARDGRRPELPREPVQPRGAERAPAGVVVQAVRARDGARAGDRAGDDVRVEAAERLPRRQVRLDRELRGRLPRDDRPHDRDDPLRQLGLHAADAARRAEGRRRRGEAARRHERAQRLPLDRPRRRGGQPARARPRVRPVRERRLPDRPARAGQEREPAPRDQGDPRRRRRPDRRERADVAQGARDAHGDDRRRHPAQGRDRGHRQARGARRNGRSRARPARPRTTATRGSSATRRRSSSRCGSATRPACARC